VNLFLSNLPEQYERMTNKSMVESSKVKGPSGFLQSGANLLVVDYGKIYHPDGSQIGFLFEDGLIEGQADPLGKWDGLKTIEELSGAVFQGIDSHGLQLILPESEKGPIGALKYNKRDFFVLFGRIATPDHKVVGHMSDDGTLYFRDPRFPDTMRKMDDNSQLSTFFQGTRSNGQAWRHEFQRPLYKPDKSYFENEIIRYFEDIDRINAFQKKYVFDSMKLYALSGLLHLVRKSEGTAGLGNVKHGASGVTGVRTGKVTLDRDEFEREVQFFKKFGALMAVPSRVKPLIEVRINMVVAHEYGHQLEFCLTQSMQDHVNEIYEKRLNQCNREHPIPEDACTLSELVEPHLVEERHFVSGYAHTSRHEYFAECVAAFAIKESRDALKKVDPELYELLMNVTLHPEKVMSTLEGKRENILNLQTSLRLGGELIDEDLFNE
jgi:hypothetical protein